jgi:hypothetical protein
MLSTVKEIRDRFVSDPTTMFDNKMQVHKAELTCLFFVAAEINLPSTKK